MEKTWAPNELQKAFMNSLADGKEKTLAEISAELGKEIKTGSINTLISKGLVVSKPKTREIVCPHCGAKHKVSTYSLPVKG